ncbi:hypothetical protein Tco_0429051 [Tanacetum coccineum]
MDNQIIWESGKEELIAQEAEKEAPVFYGLQRNPNEQPIFLWNKDLFYFKNGNFKTKKYSAWGKILYRKNHQKTRSDIEEVYSNVKIIKVIKVKNVETHGKDFMEEIVVKRANEKAYIISEFDYKYLNKNDTKDIYLIYQIKINLTALTLVIPSIEALEHYTIIIGFFISIVYENIKKERKVTNIHELPKFFDATLKRVLKKIEKILLAANHGFKEPPLSEEHKEVMELCEAEIKERLKFRSQMRR